MLASFLFTLFYFSCTFVCVGNVQFLWGFLLLRLFGHVLIIERQVLSFAVHHFVFLAHGVLCGWNTFPGSEFERPTPATQHVNSVARKCDTWCCLNLHIRSDFFLFWRRVSVTSHRFIGVCECVGVVKCFLYSPTLKASCKKSIKMRLLCPGHTRLIKVSRGSSQMCTGSRQRLTEMKSDQSFPPFRSD